MSLFAELGKNGYKFVDMSQVWMVIDAQLAARAKCEKCGKKMHYEGYTLGNPLISYRAFAVCNKCGHYEEF